MPACLQNSAVVSAKKHAKQPKQCMVYVQRPRPAAAVTRACGAQIFITRHFHLCVTVTKLCAWHHRSQKCSSSTAISAASILLLPSQQSAAPGRCRCRMKYGHTGSNKSNKVQLLRRARCSYACSMPASLPSEALSSPCTNLKCRTVQPHNRGHSTRHSTGTRPRHSPKANLTAALTARRCARTHSNAIRTCHASQSCHFCFLTTTLHLCRTRAHAMQHLARHQNTRTLRMLAAKHHSTHLQPASHPRLLLQPLKTQVCQPPQHLVNDFASCATSTSASRQCSQCSSTDPQ